MAAPQVEGCQPRRESGFTAWPRWRRPIRRNLGASLGQDRPQGRRDRGSVIGRNLGAVIGRILGAAGRRHGRSGAEIGQDRPQGRGSTFTTSGHGRSWQGRSWPRWRRPIMADHGRSGEGMAALAKPRGRDRGFVIGQRLPSPASPAACLHLGQDRPGTPARDRRSGIWRRPRGEGMAAPQVEDCQPRRESGFTAWPRWRRPIRRNLGASLGQDRPQGRRDRGSVIGRNLGAVIGRILGAAGRRHGRSGAEIGQDRPQGRGSTFTTSGHGRSWQGRSWPRWRRPIMADQAKAWPRWRNLGAVIGDS